MINERARIVGGDQAGSIREPVLGNPIRILMRRTAGLGDVILSSGIPRALHERYQGQVVVDVMTGNHAVFEGNPYVGKILTAVDGVSLDGYEQIINLDFAYERNPHLHIAAAYAATVFGDADKWLVPELYPTTSSAIRVESLRKKIGGRYVVIHARNARLYPARNLPGQLWADVIERLLDASDLQIVTIGSGGDFQFSGPRIHSFHGTLDLHDTYGLISGAAAFVGVDSGMFHVAACTEIPIIGIFTQARHELRQPLRRHAGFVALSTDLPCYGCIHEPTTSASLAATGCLRGDLACTRSFSPEAIVGAVASMTHLK